MLKLCVLIVPDYFSRIDRTLYVSINGIGELIPAGNVCMRGLPIAKVVFPENTLKHPV